MKVTDIIVLENQKRYSLISEVICNNSKYFLAMEINSDGKEISDSTAVLKLIPSEDGDYVQIVNDMNELKAVHDALKESTK